MRQRSSLRLQAMHKQMAQLRVRGAVRRHDGARGRAHLPIHAPLRPDEHAILGRSLLTIRLRVCLHQPSHHRLSDLALRCGGGVEEREVEQGVRVSMGAYEHANAHQCPLERHS